EMRLADPMRIFPEGGRGIIPVDPPAGMMEVDHEVAVIRDYGLPKRQPSDPFPVPDRASLVDPRAKRLSVVGHFDVEDQFALRLRVTPVVDLCHDLLPKVEALSGDPGLGIIDQKA